MEGPYLQIKTAGARSWVFRYRNGRAQNPARYRPRIAGTVSLADARAKATDKRNLVLAGIDSIEARKRDKVAAVLHASKAIIFKERAEAYVTAHREGWCSQKHAAYKVGALGITRYARPLRLWRCVVRREVLPPRAS